MIEIKEVLEIHHILIEEFGGSIGVRDENLLRSAIQRPFSGSENIEFYPTIHEKAGVLIESIVKNHPFVDGNKRTGFVIMRLFLLQNNFDIKASQDEKYEFVINIAKNEFNKTQISTWILDHLVI